MSSPEVSESASADSEGRAVEELQPADGARPCARAHPQPEYRTEPTTELLQNLLHDPEGLEGGVSEE